MVELPRSRALVRLDGPGHIMPVEPVTPPGSTVWRVVHLPPFLVALGVGLLVVAAFALALLSVGFRSVAGLPGLRYVAPPIGALAVAALYYGFVRLVERRSAIDEFDAHGSLIELGLAIAGGLAWSVAMVVVLVAFGAIHVVGLGAPGALVAPLVEQLSAAVILELVLCGLVFRLAERLLGSWLTLGLIAAAFAAARLAGPDASLAAVVAAATSAALLFGILYMVTRRLWAAIGFGVAWKFAQIAIYGVTTDAGPLPGLIASYVAGPRWLTGGTAGTDAAVPVVVLNVALAVALLFLAVRWGRIVRPAWRRGRG